MPELVAVPQITALYAGLLGLMAVVLSILVGRYRAPTAARRVSIGDGGRPEVLRFPETGRPRAMWSALRGYGTQWSCGASRSQVVLASPDFTARIVRVRGGSSAVESHFPSPPAAASKGRSCLRRSNRRSIVSRPKKSSCN